MCRAKSKHAALQVAAWIAESRNMGHTKLSNGIFVGENRVKRVAVLNIMKDKELIEERELLDTEGLPYGEVVHWMLCAVGETAAVVVVDCRGDEWEYSSVTLYRSHIRQQTVQLNIILNVFLFLRSVLVNENTLLLVSDYRKRAVVSRKVATCVAQSRNMLRTKSHHC